RPQSAEELSRPLRKFVAQADLGDLARKVGAKVAKLRGDATVPTGEAAGAPEGTPHADVTRTFATRSLEEPRPTSAETDEGAPAPDVATRRMSDEEGSWSTGKKTPPAAPPPTRAAAGRYAFGGAAVAVLVLAAIAGTTALRGEPTTFGVPTAAAKP